MNVLVTGGAGFIGANLVQYLSACGSYGIVVLDDLSAGQQRPVFPRGVKFTQGDFTDKTTLVECLQGIDAVVHLAARSGVADSIKDPRPSFETNVVGSFQLLELARAANIDYFVNASTAGALLGQPKPPVSEDIAPRPLSPYGAAKLAVEGYCSAFAGAYGLPCLTLRFSNIYGPWSAHRATAVAAFVKNIITGKPLVVYGDGTQQRDYLFVDDLVRGIESAVKRRRTGTYQLGSGQPTTLKALIAMLRKVSCRDFQVRYEPRRGGEVHSIWCNIAKAETELAYSAPTCLETGLRTTWTWYLENQDIWARQIVSSTAD